MMVENLPVTGVVIPTTWRRTAYRIAKRGRIVGCARFVVRYVDGQECMVLIHSGCSQTLVSKVVCRFWKQKSTRVLTANGIAKDTAE